MVGQFARSPLLVIPRGLAFQPIATAEVADRLTEHLNDGPAGRAPDFGGPEILSASAVATSWLAAHKKRRAVLVLPLPGSLGRALKGGVNLAPDGARGRFTWQHYLDDVPAAGPGVRDNADPANDLATREATARASLTSRSLSLVILTTSPIETEAPSICFPHRRPQSEGAVGIASPRLQCGWPRGGSVIQKRPA